MLSRLPLLPRGLWDAAGTCSGARPAPAACVACFHSTEDVRENLLAILLSTLVSLLGFLTLNRGFCRDLWVLLFCLVMASCQYSLLKARPVLPAGECAPPRGRSAGE